MTTREDSTTSATLRRAFATMERMQRRIEEYERARTGPIAVIGIGARLPGGIVDTDTFWQLLVEGRDAVREIPQDRWDTGLFYDERPLQPGRSISRWGGFLDHVDRFDHEFFGISRREAVSMDPQQRLVLEVAWEALENAGLAPRSLAGSSTGCYLGMCGNDYGSQVFRYPDLIAAHASTGNAQAIASGRLSYLLDLKGPSVTLDTACSSSLVALHQACQGLRLGETDLALAGAVNVVLSPHLAISFSQFPEMLAADGRCKAFDASANGFVRSEGCGIVVLKRLEDALRDGDPIHAVIRGSAANQDGRSSGLTAPSGAAQQIVLRRALENAGVAPERVAYIETHGTGTKLGDPIEVEAIAEVYGRREGHPLYLGAVKTNLGHLEAAAGIAGLIKAALVVEHGLIPPNLHFRELNPHISLDGTTIAVPTALTPWPDVEGPRVAGLSSFGFSGTNMHVIVEQAPERAAAEPDERRPRSVLTLSARTETALLKLARRYHDQLTDGRGDSLADVAYSANTGRSHLPYRLAVTGADAQEVADRLADHVYGEPAEGLVTGRAGGADTPGVVFLFTGQGPQRAGMARELYETQPTFRAVLDRCDEILRPVLERPLLEALYPPEGGDRELINRMDYAQPGLFAVEYALATLWTSWGVEPAAVLGHSLGEYAAACFAGAMTLEEGLPLVAERGRLLQQLAAAGAMAAVRASREDVVAELAAHDPAEISVAAVNGPANTTVSGTRAAVEAVVAAFTARDVEARVLHISTSSHCPLVEPVLDPLRAALRQVTFTRPRIPLVSNLTGQLWPWDAAPDVEYWISHARRPVQFTDGVQTLRDLGYRTFVEVGPAPTLLGLAAEILTGADVLLLPSLRPKAADWDVLLGSVARLYVGGVDLDWRAVDQDYTRRRVRLPLYPFDPTRVWHDLGNPNLSVDRPDPGAAATADGTDADGTGADGVAGTDGAAPRRAARPARPTLPSAPDVLGLPPGERVDAVLGPLLASVQGSLGATASGVDPDLPLSTLGLDSLMAVEIRNEIHGRLGVTVTIANFLAGATARSVAQHVVTSLDATATGTATGTGTGTPVAAAPAIRRAARAQDVAADLLARIEAGALEATEAGRG